MKCPGCGGWMCFDDGAYYCDNTDEKDESGRPACPCWLKRFRPDEED